MKMMKEKWFAFVNKISFVGEGIFSLLLAISVFELFTTKFYQGYFSKPYLIFSILLAIIVIEWMVYNTKKSKKKLEKLFLTFMIPIGMFYLVFMLPTYAPDESAHIWRIYDFSEGHIFAQQDEEGNSIGTNVPEELIEAKQETLNSYAKLKEMLARGGNSGETVNVISPAQAYPFVLYLPAAIVFGIVRLCHIPILWGLYLAKLANFVIFLAGGYYAIKKIPFGKYILLACLFLPMVLQQAVSLSADSIINTGLFVYIAYTIALVFQKEKITKRQLFGYSLLILFVSLAKMAYVPMIGLGFMLIFSKQMTKKEKIAIFGVGTLICIILVGVNYIYSTTLVNPSAQTYYEAQNVNGTEQIKGVLSNPISFVKVLKNTIDVYGESYLFGMIASPLGWLDIVVSPLITIAFLVLVIFSSMIENNEVAFSRKQKIWNFLIVVGTALLIIGAMYISWTGVGAEVVEGVQGRYFIPLLPLLLLCVSMKQNYIKWNHVHLWLPIVLVLLNGITLNTIFQHFLV